MHPCALPPIRHRLAPARYARGCSPGGAVARDGTALPAHGEFDLASELPQLLPVCFLIDVQATGFRIAQIGGAGRAVGGRRDRAAWSTKRCMGRLSHRGVAARFRWRLHCAPGRAGGAAGPTASRASIFPRGPLRSAARRGAQSRVAGVGRGRLRDRWPRSPRRRALRHSERRCASSTDRRAAGMRGKLAPLSVRTNLPSLRSSPYSSSPRRRGRWVSRKACHASKASGVRQ